MIKFGFKKAVLALMLGALPLLAELHKPASIGTTIAATIIITIIVDII